MRDCFRLPRLNRLTMVSFCAWAAILQAQQDDAKRMVPFSGRRLALVVGNKDYSWKPLTNPVRDAQSVAGVLRDLGFAQSDIHLVLNARQSELRRQVREFVEVVRPGDFVFVYYSGHGVEVKGINYLLPVDIPQDATEGYVEDEAVSAQKLLRDLNDHGARVRVLILDACRDNPLRAARSTAGGLSAMEGRGSLIVFATEAGRTASDNATGANGLFTQYLLDGLQMPGVSIDQAMRDVSRKVARASGEKQVPAIYGLLLEDVILRPGGVTPTPNKTSLVVTGPSSLASVEWEESIKPLVERSEAAERKLRTLKTSDAGYGNALRERRQAGDALIAAYTGFLRREPNNVEILLRRASEYDQLDEHSSAAKDYEVILKAKPDDTDSWERLWDCYDRLGRADFIVRSTAEFIRQVPQLTVSIDNVTTALYLRAHTQIKLNQYKAAATDLYRAQGIKITETLRDLSADPSELILLRVVDPSGAPVSGAPARDTTVNVEVSDGPDLEFPVSEDGYFALAVRDLIRPPHKFTVKSTGFKKLEVDTGSVRSTGKAVREVMLFVANKKDESTSFVLR